MKKLIIMILLAMPLAMHAQKDTKYLAGAVPQDENGLVVWEKTIDAPGIGRQQVYSALKSWIEGVAQDAIKDLRTRQVDANEAEGLVVWRIEEWMVFKRQFLLLDKSRFRYQISAKCQDGSATLAIRQISYYYGEDDRGENGEVYKAEEWITDKAAMNKKKTKLYKYSAKFRRKTVDRVEELFNQASQTLHDTAQMTTN